MRISLNPGIILLPSSSINCTSHGSMAKLSGSATCTSVVPMMATVCTGTIMSPVRRNLAAINHGVQYAVGDAHGLAGGMACPSASAEPARKMNVLFLVADDLNSWLLKNPDRYRGKVIAPNLQRLADSGVNFVNAYTASPVCSPSRTAFFSGVAPWKSGHYHNALEVRKSKPLSRALSLAGLFKKAGYSTAAYGKITHGWDQKEHWDEKIGHKRDPAPPGAPLTKIGRGEQDWGPIHLAEEKMNDTLNVDAAIRRLNQRHDRPFFVACGTFNPHMPWYVPKKYFDMFPLDEVTTPDLRKGRPERCAATRPTSDEGQVPLRR